MLKKLTVILISFIIHISFANISQSIEPDVFVQSTVNRAAKTLGGDLTKEQRIDELKKIALDTVDIHGIGMYSLGSHRKTTNKDQLKEYNEVFKSYFLKSFASRLAEYSNPVIEV